MSVDIKNMNGGMTGRRIMEGWALKYRMDRVQWWQYSEGMIEISIVTWLNTQI